MMIKPYMQNLLFITVGALIFLVPLVIVVLFQLRQDPTEQAALHARRLEVAGRMRLSLASASEAEKSAVMANTEKQAQAFAEQARAASAVVEQGRAELAQLVQAGGTPSEKDLLERFS